MTIQERAASNQATTIQGKPTYEQLEQRCQELEQEVKRKDQLLGKANERIKYLQGVLNWEDKLFATPSEQMPDAQKIIARTLPTIIQKSKARSNTDTARDDGLTRIYRADVAKATGKSEDRVGAGLKAMGERGSIKHRVEVIRDKETRAVKDRLILVDVTPQLIQASIKSNTLGNTGYNQKNFVLCKSCGTELVQVKKVIQGICPKCGEVHIYDPQKKEDRAFIVSSEIAEHFDEWYGNVDDTDPDPEKEPVEPRELKRQLASEAIEIPIVQDHSDPDPLPLEPMEETIKPPITIPKPIGVIPHCKHMQCVIGPNRTQWKLSGLYCPVHKGYIDESGRPI